MKGRDRHAEKMERLRQEEGRGARNPRSSLPSPPRRRRGRRSKEIHVTEGGETSTNKQKLTRDNKKRSGYEEVSEKKNQTNTWEQQNNVKRGRTGKTVSTNQINKMQGKKQTAKKHAERK